MSDPIAPGERGGNHEDAFFTSLSNARLKTVLDTVQLGLWQWHMPTGAMRCSAQARAILGLDEGASIDAFRRLVDPQDVDVIWSSEEAARMGRPFHAEYRILQPGGQTRWVSHDAAVQRDESGEPESVIGVVTDITARKLQEEALRQARDQLESRVHERTDALVHANERLSNEVEERRATESQVRALFVQLTHTEEEERRRLAREVHDSMGQHVTALTLGLKSLQAHAAVPKPVRDRLGQLLATAHRLDQELDSLAHRLHPTVLDDLGLDDALKDLARTWSETSGIPVEVFTSGLRGRRFGQAVETAIYRVVQEALNNVRKHAKATRVSLIAENRRDQLRAIVEDDGQGFVVPEKKAGSRLGLRSMAERAAQAGGRFEVESAPGQGTSIYFTIPSVLDHD